MSNRPPPLPAAHLERGSAIVWVALMLPVFLGILGLAVDGGIVFNARREVQNVADGAARAGAMQIDLDAYRRSSSVFLDERQAREVARNYLIANCRGDWRCYEPQTDDRLIVVKIEASVPTAFLSLVGISDVTVSATAPAWVRYGVDRPEN
jgi:Putative Flp pilus-assembly TadE/G-like